MAVIQLTLYGRHECHLCSDMQDSLKPYSDELGFELNIVDIDANPELISRFATKVPVLMHEKHEICHFFLDLHALQMYFSQPR